MRGGHSGGDGIGPDYFHGLHGHGDAEKQSRDDKVKFNTPEDYDSSNVSDKVIRIILSYTDYVNHVVWKKY